MEKAFCWAGFFMSVSAALIILMHYNVSAALAYVLFAIPYGFTFGRIWGDVMFCEATEDR